MIDCLSNPAWINPQTDFLLCLQNLRVGNLEIFDKFFLSITIFGEFWLPTLLCAIVYWCIDFRAGIYLFSLNGFNILVTHFAKMMACVYRPWILDKRIHPSELAVPFAKGYSFPSGHTAMSTSIFGGSALLLKKNKKAVFVCLGLIALVGFSRLWLGVHTPQDVLGGLFISSVLIFALKHLIDWAEKNKNRYLYLIAIVNSLALLALTYVCFFNSYRIDYIGGELLVNPQKSIYVTLVVYGFALGMLNGCFTCRRFIPYNPKDVSVKRRVIRGCLGTLLIITLLKLSQEYIFLGQMNTYAAVILMFLTGITITLIYPFVFTRFKS